MLVQVPMLHLLSVIPQTWFTRVAGGSNFLNLACDSLPRGAAPQDTDLRVSKEYFDVSGDIITAIKSGGTRPHSLMLNLPMLARNLSRSKRLITTEAWPERRGVV